jgi:hypothetical protein
LCAGLATEDGGLGEFQCAYLLGWPELYTYMSAVCVFGTTRELSIHVVLFGVQSKYALADPNCLCCSRTFHLHVCLWCTVKVHSG